MERGRLIISTSAHLCIILFALFVNTKTKKGRFFAPECSLDTNQSEGSCRTQRHRDSFKIDDDDDDDDIRADDSA